MNTPQISALLKKKGLKDTEARRLVIEAMSAFDAPVSAPDIHTWLQRRGHAINMVTVYRILALLQELDVVHRHPCDGGYSLCLHPSKAGQHFFLHCEACGSIEERISASLARAARSASRGNGFRVTSSIAEFTGTCRSCS